MKKGKSEARKLDWSLFTKDNQLEAGVNKGIAFENVIEQLIKAMFPTEEWRRTQESHDEKRDFVNPKDESLPDQKWAECKNYNENLSINTIAPTLVMGAINQIQCIYFFSYSKLNDNAIEGILRYAESSKKEVTVFDGILLDNLIIKYSSQIETKRFFPKDDFSTLSYDDKEKFRLICSISNINDNRTILCPKFNIGAKFALKVIVQNLTPSKNSFNYKIKAHRNIKLSRNVCDGKLEFGSIAEQKIICEGLKPGKRNLYIDLIGSKTTTKVHVEISDKLYSYWSGKNAVESYKICIDRLNSYTERPLFITGCSGIGKTTLLDLIANNEEVLKKYKIQYIDHTLAREACLRQLLFNNFGLEPDNYVDSNSQEEDKLKNLELLLTNYAQSASDLTSVLINAYDPRKPFLFIVDNAHLLNSAYARWIKSIITAAQDQRKKVYFIFATDPNVKSIEETYTDLYCTDVYFYEQVNTVRLTKFDKQDTTAYIKHFYGVSNIDKFFENYEKDQMALQRNVQRFCYIVEEKGVLIPLSDERKTKYEIVDESAFADLVEKYIYSDFVLDKTDPIFQDKYSVEFLKYIFIAGSASKPRSGSKGQSICRLIEHSILAERNNEVFFSSDETRTLVGNMLQFSKDDYIDIYALDNSSQETKAVCALNLLENLKNAYSFLDNFLISGGSFITKNQRWETCCLVLNKFKALCGMGLIHQLLLFLKKNYTPLNEEQGHYKFFSFLELAMTTFISNDWDSDEKDIEIIAYIIKKYFDRALSTYNYSEVERNYKAIKEKIMLLKDLSKSKKYYWLCHFSNRAAIAVDRASDVLLTDATNSADVLYKESEQCCSEAGNPHELKMQILIDKFYRYYVYGHSLTETKLDSLYNELLGFDTDKLHESTSLQYHLILMQYMKLKFANEVADKLKELLQTVISLRKKCDSPFYSVKLYLIEIYILVETGKYEQAYELINETKEYALKKDMRGWIYKLSCTKAFLMKICPDIEKNVGLQDQIYIAFEQFMRQRKDSVQDFKREIFLPVELAKISRGSMRKKILECIKEQNKTQDLWCKLLTYISGEEKVNPIDDFRSYFTIHGISFPNI